MTFMTSANKFMFSAVSPCLFVSRVMQIVLNQFTGMGYVPQKNPLNFGEDRVKGADPGILYYLGMHSIECHSILSFLNNTHMAVAAVQPTTVTSWRQLHF